MTSTHPALPWTDWRTLDVTSVTDGDTVRGHRSRTTALADGLTMDVYDDVRVHPRGVPLRLVNLQTPERGHADWDRARGDLARWLVLHGQHLSVATQPGGGFDRYLADIYVTGNRGDTATQHMLRRGWDPYVGRPTPTKPTSTAS